MLSPQDDRQFASSNTTRFDGSLNLATTGIIAYPASALCRRIHSAWIVLNNSPTEVPVTSSYRREVKALTLMNCVTSLYASSAPRLTIETVASAAASGPDASQISRILAASPYNRSASASAGFMNSKSSASGQIGAPPYLTSCHSLRIADILSPSLGVNMADKMDGVGRAALHD